MKNILSKIGGFFVAIYTKVFNSGEVLVQLPANMAITPALIDHCINVVNIIKKIVNNPVTVLVTDLTPIALDNDIRLKIADSLPAILAGLTYEKQALAAGNQNDAVNTILAKVRLADDPDKDALYHALAARLIMVVSDGKVTWSEAIGIIEIYFKQLFGAPVSDNPLPIVAPPIAEPVNPGNGYQPSAPLQTPAPGSVPVPVTAAIVAAADATPEQIKKAIASLTPPADNLSIKL